MKMLASLSVLRCVACLLALCMALGVLSSQFALAADKDKMDKKKDDKKKDDKKKDDGKKDSDKEKDKLMQSARNLRGLSLGLDKFHDAKSVYPATDAKLSWRVQVLPYLEEAALFKKFKHNEAWDSEHNKKLLSEMPKIFEDPRFPAPKEKGMTYYQGFKGKGAVLGGPVGLSLTTIANENGPGNTIMMVEAGAPIPWTKPDDLEVDAKKALPKFGGPKHGDFLAMFVDGCLRLIPANADEKAIRCAVQYDNSQMFKNPGEEIKLPVEKEKKDKKPEAKLKKYEGKEKANLEESSDNLRAIGVGLHAFHGAKNQFPCADPKISKLSWRVQMLPYIEQKDLYKKFKHDEAWDSEHNKKLLAEMPKIFQDPRFPAPKEKGLTYFQSMKGSGAVLGSPAGITLTTIMNQNGSSHTILVVEAGEPIPWTKPDELDFDSKNPFPKLGPKGEDFLILFADGTCNVVPAAFDQKVIRLATRYNNMEPFIQPGERMERRKSDTKKEGDEEKAKLRQSAKNLRTIGMAFQTFAKKHDDNLPCADPKVSKLSWRVQLLLNLEAEALYKKFKHDEAWDSEHNKKLLAEMPKVFQNPRFPAPKDKGMTYYQGFKGEGTVLGSKDPVTFTSIENWNGKIRTILVAEAGTAVPWTKPDDLEITPGKDRPNLGGPKYGDFLVLLADGKCRLVPSNGFEKTIRDAVRFKSTEFSTSELRKLPEIKPDDKDSK